ncbi:uncharacterized protein LOC122017318 [Zingiber officinale]|uniref:uncharacterized protein LOC122017318 n=1 Tax=Zingiber officinale TaxID=94328 RepID=UPI001C4B9D80|nr:uncharacterized protein LOC122017318 [Zingiber officinale]
MILIWSGLGSRLRITVFFLKAYSFVYPDHSSSGRWTLGLESKCGGLLGSSAAAAYPACFKPARARTKPRAHRNVPRVNPIVLIFSCIALASSLLSCSLDRRTEEAQRMESVAEKERADGTCGGPVAESLLSLPPTLTQSRRLHNFSFPTLSWGGQRVLRCLKLSDGVGSAVSVPDDQNRRNNPTKFPPAKGSPGVLERREGEARGRESERNHATAPISEADRPWNLRTRRAACNAPVETRNGNHVSPSLGAAAIEKVNFSVKTLRMGSNELEKGEMIKFSVSLSRREIEEDFFAIKGTKPPRRPKKRAKIIQRELDALFPGLWLSEITPDSYKIDEKKLDNLAN